MDDLRAKLAVIRKATDVLSFPHQAIHPAIAGLAECLDEIAGRQMRFFDVDIARGQKLFGVAGRSAEDVEARVRAKLHPDQCACAEITIVEVA